MRGAAIRVAGLSKMYRIGKRQSYRSLREGIMDAVSAPFRANRTSAPTIWALRDLSLQIGQGEVVGVIGRNGAGKSTLLKVLSRVTEPTQGRVELHGRVGSLLEVGTGFHPELTGRENIYLNGAILGMKRAEIARKFDEIVAFAEIERFLDTPVKHYSTGMYLRLAFAVAAHLEPEILLVDEVLAVGDASFQKKCLGKMEHVGHEGRTVLFVSHNMQAVARLCARAIFLQAGELVADGPAEKTVGAYIGGRMWETPTDVDYRRMGRPPGSEDVRMLGARVFSDGMAASVVDIRNPVYVQIEYEVLRGALPLHPNVHVYNAEGQCIFVTSDGAQPEAQAARPPGLYRAVVTIPGNFLAEGWHSLDVAISTFDPLMVHCWERGALSFHVSDPNVGGTARGNYAGPFLGAVRPLLRWDTEQMNTPAVAAGIEHGDHV